VFIGVSPQSVHGYRCHSTEGSWVQISVHRGFKGTGVSPQRVHSYRFQFTEDSWVQLSVYRLFMNRGVRRQRHSWYSCQSTESIRAQAPVRREFMCTGVKSVYKWKRNSVCTSVYSELMGRLQVQIYRCFMHTGVSLKRVHQCKCLSTEGP